MKYRCLEILAAVLLLTGWCSIAPAQPTRHWRAISSPDWDLPVNWIPGGTPHYRDALFVDDPAVPMMPVADETVNTGGGTGSITVAQPGVLATFQNLYVGYYGHGQLSILDGAGVFSNQTVIGSNYGGISGGDVTVDGPATWTNAATLYVGKEATGTLDVEAGGTVTSARGYIGDEPGSIGNVVTVTGAGSTWNTNTNELWIGHRGSGTLNIENGGEVASGIGFIGRYSSSVDNAVTVTGSGSTWNTGDNGLYVGYQGSGTLSIRDDGDVISQFSAIGQSSSGSGIATVAGSGSTWNTSTHELYVGQSGIGTLNVEDGGTVTSGVAHIGHYYSASGSAATITGSGSSWNISGVGGSSLFVGYQGSATLNIEDGATVKSATAYIGYQSLSSENVVTVTGATWNLGTGPLTVGYEGSGRLRIENAGQVASRGGYIGHEANSTGNIVTVTGPGSMWDTSGGTSVVGYSGSGSLNIEDGATVTTGNTWIGNTNSSSGEVTVTGAGSTWGAGGFVYVGNLGSGRLEIRDGATVSSRQVEIGRYAPSSGNLVTVTGDGSAWNTGGYAIVVGSEGSGALSIQDGGTVTSGSGLIGWNSPSSTGTVIVDRGTWNCSLLGVGGTGQATLSIAEDGQVIASGWLRIGVNGEVNLDGGLLSVGELSTLDGPLNFHSGTLQITDDDLTFAHGQPLGNTMHLTDGQTLQVDHALTVTPGASLNVIDGGRLVAGTLQNDADLIAQNSGVVSSNSGLSNTATLTVTTSTVAGPGKLTNELSGVMTASGLIDTDFDNFGNLTLSGALRLTGATNNYGSAKITTTQSLRQDGPMNNHGLIDLDGGAITGSGSLANRPGGVIRGGSGISAPMTNDGGLIHADGTSTMLIADLSGGNLNGGQLRIEDGAGINVLSDFSNAGLIVLEGPDASLLGGSIANTGTVRGEGRVTNPIANSGNIRAVENGVLMLSGAPVANGSGGIMEVRDGATLAVIQGLADNQGTIVLHGGTYDNGSGTMTNTGYITGSGTLRGRELINDEYVGVGTGDMDFIGPVVNNGSVNVQADARATFYGPVSGSGGFPGPGTVVFLASYSPGSSPAAIDFGGNLILSAAAELTMELGGTLPDDQHDTLDVSGGLFANGTLDVELLDLGDGPFNPRSGNVFDIFDWGTLGGKFTNVNLPPLKSGLSWDTSELYLTGRLAVVTVPEPSTLVLLAASVVALLAFAYRRIWRAG